MLIIVIWLSKFGNEKGDFITNYMLIIVDLKSIIDITNHNLPNQLMIGCFSLSKMLGINVCLGALDVDICFGTWPLFLNDKSYQQ